MKESLKRIVAWAKSHPWVAGGIVLGVGVLAYFVYKRGGGAAGGGIEGPGAADALGAGGAGGGAEVPSFEDLPADFGSVGGGGSITDSFPPLADFGGGDLGGFGGGDFGSLGGLSFDSGPGFAPDSYYSDSGAFDFAGLDGGSADLASYASGAKMTGITGSVGKKASVSSVSGSAGSGRTSTAPKTGRKPSQPTPARQIFGVLADTALGAIPGFGGLYSAARGAQQIGRIAAQNPQATKAIAKSAISPFPLAGAASAAIGGAFNLGRTIGRNLFGGGAPSPTPASKGTFSSVTGSVGKRSTYAPVSSSTRSYTSGKSASPTPVTQRNPYTYGSALYNAWQTARGLPVVTTRATSPSVRTKRAGIKTGR